MRVGIVGRGRLGLSLAAMCEGVGLDVALGGRGAPLVGTFDAILLTVPDAAVADVARGVDATGPLLHTSGALPVEVMRPRAPVGSLHPLMTFPGVDRGLPDRAGLPAAIDGDPEARDAARALCERLGFRWFVVPGDRRLYHAAAVLAGNLATALLADAAAALTAAGVPAEDAPALLAPLALQSLRNAARIGPRDALTGPVARGDEATIAGHRAALSDAGLDAIRGTYDLLTERARALKAGRT
jgi:predicted short-subunit dehydrogenase-like oxidoreductase (DUF2520 family)